jgi:chorismate-pyruvate lyase
MLTPAAATETELLYPLTLFRRNGGGPLPAYEVIEGEAVPEPYRKLLVHHGDMTSRLEAFHGGSLVLELLHREHNAKAYRREVVLHVEKTGLAVEYGAIEIRLEAFAAELRTEILQEHLPLGGLLNRHGVRYRSEPRAFFKMGADRAMSTLFDAPADAEFYGRSNLLLGEDDRVLARIVEVLRPQGAPR